MTVILKCFGVATGYLVAVGDCMTDALDYLVKETSVFDKINENALSILQTRQLWISIAILSVNPISFYPTLDKLKYTSAFYLDIVSSLIIGIILYALHALDP